MKSFLTSAATPVKKKHFKKTYEVNEMSEIYEIDTKSIYKIKGFEIPGDVLIHQFINGLRYEKLNEELAGGNNE